MCDAISLSPPPPPPLYPGFALIFNPTVDWELKIIYPPLSSNSLSPSPPPSTPPPSTPPSLLLHLPRAPMPAVSLAIMFPSSGQLAQPFLTVSRLVSKGRSASVPGRADALHVLHGAARPATISRWPELHNNNPVCWETSPAFIANLLVMLAVLLEPLERNASVHLG